MNSPTRRVAWAASLCLLAAALAGCTASHAVAQPTSSHAVTSSPTPTGPDAAVSTTCALVSALETTVEQARMRHDSGTLTDAQFAAVVSTAPTTVDLIGKVQGTGLPQDVDGLAIAIQQSPPTVAGAAFDPAAPAYAAAISAIDHDCQANGTPVAILALPGQG